MHEMSLTRSMIRIVQEEAIAQAFSQVLVLRLEVGVLSSVEPAAMEFCFDAVAKGTPAEGARLSIVSKPGEAWCHACENVITLAARYDPCPQCQGHKLQIRSGEELRILNMEVA